MNVHKLNESFSVIDADPEKLRNVYDFLKVERPNAWFEGAVKAGFKSPFEYFGSIQNKKLLVMNGHLQLLQGFGIQPESTQSEYTEGDLDEFLNSLNLPFEPYDFQITAFKESILNCKQINKMCTGSGKSLTIFLLFMFLKSRGKKGLLLVPTISLLSQMKSDFSDYLQLDEDKQRLEDLKAKLASITE